MTGNSSPTAIQYGIGPIGSEIVEVGQNAGFEFIGGVDIDPNKIGSDLGTVAGLDEPLGAEVHAELDHFSDREPDVVFHSTVSALSDAAPQLKEALSIGSHVISTCEELAYPWYKNSTLANELDELAINNEVGCLGTGINPGFVMDALPAFATAPCRKVQSIEIKRIQDAATRREPLQEKIGAGLSPTEFEEEIVTDGGHIGLPESIAMLGDALGWEIESIDETIEPVIGDAPVESDYVSVSSGEVAGIKQTATATVNGNQVIKLDEQMYIGAEKPVDHISITGDPDVDLSIEGGYHGDISTPAVIINAAKQLIDVEPGLQTMLDLSIPACTNLT